MWKARSSPNARVHRPPPDANIDDGAVREYLKDTVSRADHHGNIRIVVKFPQSRGKALRNELQAWPGRIEDR
jgi:hypothetical protein